MVHLIPAWFTYALFSTAHRSSPFSAQRIFAVLAGSANFFLLERDTPLAIVVFPADPPLRKFFSRRDPTASGPRSTVFYAYRSTSQPGFFPRRFYRRLQFTVLCLNIDSASPCSAAPCSSADLIRLLIISLRHIFLCAVSFLCTGWPAGRPWGTQ